MLLTILYWEGTFRITTQFWHWTGAVMRFEGYMPVENTATLFKHKLASEPVEYLVFPVFKSKKDARHYVMHVKGNDIIKVLVRRI